MPITIIIVDDIDAATVETAVRKALAECRAPHVDDPALRDLDERDRAAGLLAHGRSTSTV